MLMKPLPGLTPYADALALQEQAVADLLAGGPETAFFLEHPPCFTTGTGASAAELLDVGNIPVIATGRGGKTTYHGPGQRVVYVIKDLRQTKDLRAYVRSLQDWLIASLAEFGVQAFTTDDVGVWVHPTFQHSNTPALPPAKIAAIGVRVRKWVAFHGIALNVAPDMSAYRRIIPCGLNLPVTSLADLGIAASLPQVDEVLARKLAQAFPSL